MKIRTRYAPSPTGRMHVGNLRTALYAYLIAKHEDGDYIRTKAPTRTEDAVPMSRANACARGSTRNMRRN